MNQYRNILRLSGVSSSAPKVSKSGHKICTNRQITTSTTPLLSQFKYDAPWLDYTANNYISKDEPPTVKNFINGKFEVGTVGDTGYSTLMDLTDIPIYNPSTNDILSYVLESNYVYLPKGENSLENAVVAAKAAYPSWSNTPVQTRQRLLLDYAHFLHKPEVGEEITYWITLENGKTTADAMGDVWRGLEVVEAATRVGTDMLVRCRYLLIFCICYEYSTYCYLFGHREIHCKTYQVD